MGTNPYIRRGNVMRQIFCTRDLLALLNVVNAIVVMVAQA